MVYAIAAFPLGVLADHIGLMKVFITGLVLFAIVYAGMTISGNWYWYLLAFGIAGIAIIEARR